MDNIVFPTFEEWVESNYNFRFVYDEYTCEIARIVRDVRYNSKYDVCACCISKEDNPMAKDAERELEMVYYKSNHDKQQLCSWFKKALTNVENFFQEYKLRR